MSPLHLSNKLGTLATSTFAALALTLAPHSATAQVQTSGEYQGFEWVLNGNAVSITGIAPYPNSPYGAASIPASVPVQTGTNPDGSASYTSYPTTSIVVTSGVGGSFITISSLYIPPSVTSLQGAVFWKCYNLESITLPETLTSLPAYMCGDCGALTSINIPNGITFIPEGTFYNCSSLHNLHIPDNVTEIGDSAFYACWNLNSVALPKNLNVIDDDAFETSGLDSITVPGSVTSVGANDFAYCPNLTTVCFEGNAPTDGGRIFNYSPVPTVNYDAGTSGWGTTFSGVTTTPCDQCVGIITDPPQTGNLYTPLNLPNQSQNLVLLIHGWTPGSSTPYSDDAAMPVLTTAIQGNLPQYPAGTWDVVFYDWSDPFVQYTSATDNPGANPIQAVRNAVNLGDILGQQLAASHYQNILLIGHSAGTWMASGIAENLLAANSPIKTSVTLLDAFVPSKMPFPFNLEGVNYPSGSLGQGIDMVEQYFHSETIPCGLGIVLPNAVDYDITALQTCAGDTGDWHGWPIRWYTDTVEDPGVCYGDNLGYPNAFLISGAEGVDNVLSCPSCSSSGQAQSQIAGSSVHFAQGIKSQGEVSSVNYEQGTLTTAFGEVIPLPPMPPGFIEYMENLAATQNSVSAQDSGVPMPQGGTDGGSSDTNSAPAQPQYSSPATPQIEVLGSDASFAGFTTLAQGGNGTITPDTNGIGTDFTTTNFVWGTFAVNTTNDITLGTVDYTLLTPCDSVLGMYLDGQPIQYIQSTTNNPLSSYEMFPLSSALGMGNHNLTVSLESLDGAPITATLNTIGLYYYASQPVITSQSVDTNGNFVFTYEAGAGLNYQPQSSTNLGLGQWSNLGGVQTPLTNSLMTVAVPMVANQQQFFRVALVQ